MDLQAPTDKKLTIDLVWDQFEDWRGGEKNKAPSPNRYGRPPHLCAQNIPLVRYQEFCLTIITI